MMVARQKCAVMEYAVFGKFVYDKGLTKKQTIKIETLAGVKELKLNVNDGKVEFVTVDMGEPILNADKIPVVSKEDYVKNLQLEVLDKHFKFTCVSMGNPHAVTFLEDTEDLEKFELEKYGPIVEKDAHFPKKTNVEFIKIIDKKNMQMRVWERGSGETLACGTGACASVVAAVLNGYIDTTATVKLLGGDLQIQWNKNDNHVYMTGPAKIVFEGEMEEIYG